MDNHFDELKTVSKKNIQEWHDQIVTGTIQKLASGASTVLFTMPTGSGKTIVLKRIAEELNKPKEAKILFITCNDMLVEQLERRIGDAIPKYDILSFSAFKKSANKYMLSYDYIMVSDLRISDRRELTGVLTQYKGKVIAVSSIPYGF